MSDNVSFLDQYAPQGTGADGSAYRAADTAAGEGFTHRLRIDYSNGDTNIFHYANLISVYASGGALSLLFTSGMVYLEGDNLGELLDGLHDERIRTLRAFDPQRHDAPAGDAVVIRWMEFQDVGEETQDGEV